MSESSFLVEAAPDSASVSPELRSSGGRRHCLLYYGSNCIVLALLVSKGRFWTASGLGVVLTVFEPLATEAWELFALQCTTWLLYAASVGSDPGYLSSNGNGAGPEGDLESTYSSWPPLRAHYCKEAGEWVAKYDHWCPMLGTPIGEKNHCRSPYWLSACGYPALQVLVALLVPDSEHSRGPPDHDRD